MAFPFVDTSSQGTGNAVSNFTATYPTTVDAGDLIILFLSLRSPGATITMSTPPSGFTAITNTSGAGGGDDGITFIYAEEADGTEDAGSITFSISGPAGASNLAWACYAIKDWDDSGGVTGAVEASTITFASTTTPDPPSFTPTWGSNNIMWIAGTGTGPAQVTASVFPYADNQISLTTAGAADAGIHLCTDEVAAATENPGTFTIGTSTETESFTLAVLGTSGTPTVAAFNTTVNNAALTTHTVNLPSGITAGELLLLFITNKQPSVETAITAGPSGYTLLASDPTSGTQTGYIYGKVASGSEGSSITYTTGAGCTDVSYTLRITDWYGTLDGVQLEAATGTSSYPDTPSLTPDWGGGAVGQDCLWLSAVLYDRAYTYGSGSDPTNYTTPTSAARNSQNAGAVVAYRANEVATENPGAWSGSTATSWWGWTLAIHAVVADGPVLADSSEGESAANSTSHTVSYPTTATISSGDLLILEITTGRTAVVADISSFPSGFTLLASEESQKTGYIAHYLMAKIAAGTESGTEAFTTTNAVAHAFTMTLIKNWEGSSLSSVKWSKASGINGAVNPPALTPGWEPTLPVLFITATGVDFNPGNSEANYTDEALGIVSTIATSAQAYRNLTADSDDPGVYNSGNPDYWTSWTLGVPPLGAILLGGPAWQINIGDVWKTVAGVQINIGDAWKTVDAAQINIGDAWKDT